MGTKEQSVRGFIELPLRNWTINGGKNFKSVSPRLFARGTLFADVNTVCPEDR